MDQVEKLLLEYAETCEALGSEYQRKGCEAGAEREFEYADKAPQIVPILRDQLLGIDGTRLEAICSEFKNIR